jgi:rod shape-determining protein MreD
MAVAAERGRRPVSQLVKARLRIAVVLVMAILIETALGSDLRVAGVAPDLMVLVTICAGLSGGAEAGAWVGFWAGLITDLFLTSTPLGLSALTYCLIGAAVGVLRAVVLPDSRLIQPVAALIGTAAAVLLWVALGDVLGQSQLLDAGRSWLIRVVVVEATWATLLAVPVGWLYARAARGSKGADLMGADRMLVGRGDRLLAR